MIVFNIGYCIAKPIDLATQCCNFVSIAEGEYVLGLGFRKNVFITPPKDLLHLYAFNPQSGLLMILRLANDFIYQNNDSRHNSKHQLDRPFEITDK